MYHTTLVSLPLLHHYRYHQEKTATTTTTAPVPTSTDNNSTSIKATTAAFIQFFFNLSFVAVQNRGPALFRCSAATLQAVSIFLFSPRPSPDFSSEYITQFYSVLYAFLFKFKLSIVNYLHSVELGEVFSKGHT
jgi:hypothetical protein